MTPSFNASTSENDKMLIKISVWWRPSARTGSLLLDELGEPYSKHPETSLLNIVHPDVESPPHSPLVCHCYSHLSAPYQFLPIRHTKI